MRARQVGYAASRERFRKRRLCARLLPHKPEVTAVAPGFTILLARGYRDEKKNTVEAKVTSTIQQKNAKTFCTTSAQDFYAFLPLRFFPFSASTNSLFFVRDLTRNTFQPQRCKKWIELTIAISPGFTTARFIFIYLPQDIFWNFKMTNCTHFFHCSETTVIAKICIHSKSFFFSFSLEFE